MTVQLNNNNLKSTSVDPSEESQVDGTTNLFINKRKKLLKRMTADRVVDLKRTRHLLASSYFPQ